MKLSYKYLIAIIYTVTLFLDRLDLTIVNITLPSIAKSFHISMVATDVVNLSFLLALAISIPISTWLGERFGEKNIYILSMCLFGLGSTLCFFATDLNTLIVLRFIHGIGGGMLIPVGMTMIYKTFDESEYASITSFTFLPALMAPALGPFLGGMLLDHLGWHFVFLFSGPICLALAIISILCLKKESVRPTKKPLDWLGFVSFSAILMGVFYLFSLLGEEGSVSILSGGVIVLVGLISFFIYWEKRVAIPLIDLKFFAKNSFLKANIVQLCFQTCHLGAIFLMGMYLQLGIGLSATLAGLIMGMQAIGAMAVNRFVVRLFKRYGPKLPITVGLLGVAVLSPCVLFIQNNMVIMAVILFFVRGIFSGLCGTPIQTLGVIGFSKNQLGAVNTVFNSSRQVSISFGVTLSSILMGWGLHAAGLSGANMIPADAVFKVFALGFFAIPVIAGIGVWVIQGLKSADPSLVSVK